MCDSGSCSLSGLEAGPGFFIPSLRSWQKKMNNLRTTTTTAKATVYMTKEEAGALADELKMKPGHKRTLPVSEVKTETRMVL